MKRPRSKKLKKLQFIQPTSRHWSQWLEATGFEVCCDCGLSHKVQYAVKTQRNGRTKLFKRVRAHKGRTKQWRKQQEWKCRKV